MDRNCIQASTQLNKFHLLSTQIHTNSSIVAISTLLSDSEERDHWVCRELTTNPFRRYILISKGVFPALAVGLSDSEASIFMALFLSL